MHFIHNRRKSKSKASEPEAKQSDKSQGDSGSRTSRSGGGTFEHFRSHNPFVQEKPIHITGKNSLDRPVSEPAPFLPQPNVRGTRGHPTPNTPADVQEAYESAYSKNDGVVHRRKEPLSEHDIKAIFSGAPHFLLERGRRAIWYPHVIFPWDENYWIQNLLDRRPLRHSSFTLATFHAHLPVSKEWTGIQIYPDSFTERQGKNRPSFDVGVFEVPNMLSGEGKEPGCVGFANYMELPVAHAVRNIPYPPTPKLVEEMEHIIRIGHRNEPYSECHPGIIHDRHVLIKEGPLAWKRIGVRDCSISIIAKRLEALSNLRDEIILQGKPVTLLDKESVPVLHHNLFTTFLYPPPRSLYREEHYSLKSQIHILTQVSTVRGAWIDFSLVEWRLRVGQALWEIPPHQDGDCWNLPPSEQANVNYLTLERKWLLMQLLLQVELALRVDAAIKYGVIEKSPELKIAPLDVYQLDAMRTDSGDWSFVFARRLFENMTIFHHPYTGPDRLREQTQKRRRSKAWSKIIATSTHEAKSPDVESAWDCALLPRYPRRQLEGLMVFASILKWPDLERLKENMTSKLESVLTNQSRLYDTFTSPIQTHPLPEGVRPLDRDDMYRKSHTSCLVQLHQPWTPSNVETPYLGGWISRTWLSGLILPGEAISGILMATLLENDEDAMKRLGPIANLYGGFIYKAKSWWSKKCVVGKVLCCLQGSIDCTGWVSCEIVPQDTMGKDLPDGWFEVITIDLLLKSPVPRIFQGRMVLLESSPLGTKGELASTAFNLPMDGFEANSPHSPHLAFKNITLSEENHESEPGRPRRVNTTVSFTLTLPELVPHTISFPLTYNVQFISSHTCLPPYGFSARGVYNSVPRQSESRRDSLLFNADNDFNSQLHSDYDDNTSRRSTRLPGHPLHSASFPYSYLPLLTLPSTPFPPTAVNKTTTSASSSPNTTRNVSPSRLRRVQSFDDYRPLATERDPRLHPHETHKHTYIIDACGSKDKEAFARAWCASVGTNAVVGRIGRTCLACCIREARAADVDVVIRVGAGN